MPNYDNEMPKASQLPRIENEMQVLRKRQDELSDIVETLESRLSPILKRSNVSTGAGKIGEIARPLVDGMSPLAENITVSGDRIQIIIMRIEELMQRLEV
jgi:hypothetical protein